MILKSCLVLNHLKVELNVIQLGLITIDKLCGVKTEKNTETHNNTSVVIMYCK